MWVGYNNPRGEREQGQAHLGLGPLGAPGSAEVPIILFRRGGGSSGVRAGSLRTAGAGRSGKRDLGRTPKPRGGGTYPLQAAGLGALRRSWATRGGTLRRGPHLHGAR